MVKPDAICDSNSDSTFLFSDGFWVVGVFGFCVSLSPTTYKDITRKLAKRFSVTQKYLLNVHIYKDGVLGFWGTPWGSRGSCQPSRT